MTRSKHLLPVLLIGAGVVIFATDCVVSATVMSAETAQDSTVSIIGVVLAFASAVSGVAVFIRRASGESAR